jgi:methylmalonyl-CoA mutase
VAQANQQARAAVAAGADEIAFAGVRVTSAADLKKLLAGLDGVAVNFEGKTELVELLLAAGIARGTAKWNPFTDVKLAAKFAKAAKKDFRPLAIRICDLSEAGATTVQEIGYGIAAGVDLLAELQAQGVSVEQAAGAIFFGVAIGSHYFFQIAKLRALRLLWARVVESFGGSAEAAKATIHARTANWNATVYDPYVNALRGTTEAMSAAIGGADSFTVIPFDARFEPVTDAARRLARNTQILLKKEAQLDRVSDAGAGSYVIEWLTDTLAREAWQLMQKVEAAGGYRQQLETIHGELAKSLVARRAALASRRQVLVGTNHYPNLGETGADRLHRDPLADASCGATPFEAIRLRTEAHAAKTGRRARFLLAEIGDVKMRGARSNFAANFLGCGGFEIVTKPFQTVDEIAAEPADVVVLCSSDAEYVAVATALVKKLRDAGSKTPVVVAGYPTESLDALKQAGVEDFVHVRSNLVDVLTSWQQRLGMGS